MDIGDKQIYTSYDEFGTRITVRLLHTAVMITTQDHISPPNHIVVSIYDLEAILEAVKEKANK